jgi:hypothetical protein
VRFLVPWLLFAFTSINIIASLHVTAQVAAPEQPPVFPIKLSEYAALFVSSFNFFTLNFFTLYFFTFIVIFATFALK